MQPAPSITCPRCSRTSYHPDDIEQHYCGFCHQFHEEMQDEPLTFNGKPAQPATPELIRDAVMHGKLLGANEACSAYAYRDKIVFVDRRDAVRGHVIDADTFRHADPTEDQPVVVWGNVNAISISACAPADYTMKQVVDAVQALAPARDGHKWRIIDIASVRRGASTPSLCPHAPGRLHWFLLAQPQR